MCILYRFNKQTVLQPLVLNEQFAANLVPLRLQMSENVSAFKLCNMHEGKTKKRCFLNA